MYLIPIESSRSRQFSSHFIYLCTLSPPQSQENEVDNDPTHTKMWRILCSVWSWRPTGCCEMRDGKWATRHEVAYSRHYWHAEYPRAWKVFLNKKRSIFIAHQANDGFCGYVSVITLWSPYTVIHHTWLDLEDICLLLYRSTARIHPCLLCLTKDVFFITWRIRFVL